MSANKYVTELIQNISGTGGFLLNNEIEKSIFKNTGEYQLSLGECDNKYLNYSGSGSLITIAPPGSGKTQCFVIPNMLNWKGAAVVLDIKGEIYSATHQWRQENIGTIYKFDPLDPENSHSYNPLTFVRDDPDYIWEDSRFLAEMMIVPSGTTDPFWENMARDILTAAISYVAFNNESNDRPMSKVLDVIYGIGWDEMVISLKTNVLVSPMRRMGNSLESMGSTQRDSVLKTIQVNLSVWQGARVERITQKSDWNPKDLRTGKNTIYICIEPYEIDSYLSMLRVILAQHIQLLFDKKELKYDREKIEPILFMLDEFPQLKRMPPVEKALNVGAGYGIKIWMFAQGYGQLKEVYPNPEGLLNSCVVRTFMNLPLTDEFTEKISNMIGYKDGLLDGVRKKIVEPSELAGPDYHDYILIVATGTKPIKAKKKFAYQMPEVVSKMPIQE